jgi:hypothetical protein
VSLLITRAVLLLKMLPRARCSRQPGARTRWKTTLEEQHGDVPANRDAFRNGTITGTMVELQEPAGKEQVPEAAQPFGSPGEAQSARRR